MKMGHAASRAVGHFDHANHRDSCAVQVVKQRAVLVEICDQPELRPSSIIWGRHNDEPFTGIKK